jgi:NAD(P)H-dependent nitrite reductase small subunit
MGEFKTIIQAQDFPASGRKVVVVDDRIIALIREGETYFAIDNECPHKRGPLSAGHVEGGVVHCPMHGWGFDLATGACIDNPSRPARAYAVRVLDGAIQIEI